MRPGPTPRIEPRGPPRRWRTSGLLDRLLDLTEELPEKLFRDDAPARLADAAPERSLLSRTLRQSPWEKDPGVVERGDGLNPVRHSHAEVVPAAEPGATAGAED